MPGMTLGSVHYFSPEQARGEMVTSASDIYSAGLVLFEMLTGRRAWTGDSAGAVAVARLAGDPPAPSSIRSGIPQILDIAVRRALARMPADRPTAGDMAALLGRYIADPQGAVPRRPPACRRRRCCRRSSGGHGGSWRTDGSNDRTAGWRGLRLAVRCGRCRRGQAGARNAAAPGQQMAHPVEEEDEGGAGAWAWVAATLGVLVLLVRWCASSCSVRRPASPGRPGLIVQVPTHVGLQLADARKNAQAQGFVLSVSAYQVDRSGARGLCHRPGPCRRRKRAQGQ